MKKVVFTLTGPTCSGKTTLEKRLIERGFKNIVSHTTRPMRASERNQDSYHFVTPERFIAMVESGEMVEHVKFGEHYYGACKEEFERCFATGAPVVMVCEPEGRRQVEAFAKENGWVHVRVFVDIEAEIQADRMLTRYMVDLTDVHANSNYLEFRKNYAKRFAQMMTTERGWIMEAYAHLASEKKSAYDVVLQRYDETTEDGVHDYLMGLATAYGNLEGKVAA